MFKPKDGTKKSFWFLSSLFHGSIYLEEFTWSSGSKGWWAAAKGRDNYRQNGSIGSNIFEKEEDAIQYYIDFLIRRRDSMNKELRGLRRRLGRL